jgi:hypothetical protein
MLRHAHVILYSRQHHWHLTFGHREFGYRLLIMIVRFDATRFSIMWELDWKLTAGLT